MNEEKIVKRCKHKRTQVINDVRVVFGGIFDTRQHLQITKCLDCGKPIRKRVLRATKYPNAWGSKLVGEFDRVYKLNSKGERTRHYTYKHIPMRSREI